MPQLDEYVKRLNALKMQSKEQYEQAMDNYRANYPEFYKQLVAAMEQPVKEESKSRLRNFISNYKWYLVAIGAGVGVIIVLLFLLFTR